MLGADVVHVARDPLAEPGMADPGAVRQGLLPVVLERAGGRLANRFGRKQVGARSAASKADHVVGHAATLATGDNAPMTGGNEATMRRLYAALVERDLDTIAELSHPEVEYRNPSDAVEPGTRKGRDVIMSLTETLFETFEYAELNPARFEEAGDAMAVELHVEARSRGAGVPITQRLGHLIEFRDGTVLTIEWWNTPEAAFAALREHGGDGSSGP